MYHYLCMTLIVYHSLVGSHLFYAVQLWGQTNAKNINKMRMLLNRAIVKITFKKLYYLPNQIKKNLKILRFSDRVCMQNCVFMNQIEQNEKIAKSLSKLRYCGDNHNYHTRSANETLLDIQSFNTSF